MNKENTHRFKHLSAFLDRMIENKELPGVHLHITHKGKTVYDHLQGFSDLEKGIKLHEDQIYRIYSMTKTIISCALMKLYDQGMFSLEDPVEKFIPAFKNQRLYQIGQYPEILSTQSPRGTTIRQLLTHTSGLSSSFERLSYVDDAYRKVFEQTESFDPMKNQSNPSQYFLTNNNLEKYINTLAKLPLQYTPGEKYLYSYSTDVCARLIEVFSKKRIDRFLEEEFFRPLGMKNTTYTPTVKQQENIANLYQNPTGNTIELVEGMDAHEQEKVNKNIFIGGVGCVGLFSTTKDYTRFLQMLLNDGLVNGEVFMSKHTIKLMRQNHLSEGKNIGQLRYKHAMAPSAYYDQFGHGLGFAVAPENNYYTPMAPGSFSWAGFANTLFWVDPENELIVVMMAQQLKNTKHGKNSTETSEKLHGLVYGAID